ncbi:anti-sigma factor [Phormidium tenue FACHB-886]|nr:anti-sigma factor [Phormidium tenue FACHB-886]
MARSMLPEHLQLLIAGYVLGDLDDVEAADFEQLLATEPAIAEEVAQVQKALELTYDPPKVEPPAHLRDAILAAYAHESVAAQQSTPQKLSVAAGANKKPFPWGKLLGAAAAAAIAALGISNYRLWQTLQAIQTQPTEAEQSDDSIAYTLQATAPANAASASVLVNPSRLEATLDVENLPALPPGKVYVLWTVLKQNAPFTADSKEAILTEVFTVDAQGNRLRTIAVPDVYRSREWVAKLAVTVEDAAAPQKHTGKPILITQL